MDKTYTICIIIGIGIPLISLILGGIGGLFDGLFHGLFEMFDGLHIDFDPSIEIGNANISLFPFSIHSICSGLLLFGVTGKLIYNGHNLLLSNIVGGVIGYIAAMAIQTLIKKLKKIEHTTYFQEDLLLFDAKVVNTIVAGGFGSVSVTTFDGITTSYPAKALDKKHSIKQDTIVSIVTFEKNVAIVQEKDLTIKYDRLG